MIAFIIDLFFILFLLSAMLTAALSPLPPEFKARLDAAPDMAAKNAINKELFAIPAIHQRRVNSARFWLVLAVVYHMALRRTRGGTLGYRVAGIRLVNSENMSPSWRVLIKRFFLGMLLAGPFGASYLLCLKSPKRQALHDRLCNTWMVRSKATPAGPGTEVHRLQIISTWAIRYIDVEPLAVPTSPLSSNCDHEFGDGDYCRRCGGARSSAASVPPNSGEAS